MRSVDEVALGVAQEGSVRAVERALFVLEALSRRPDGATASELARATSTRFRGELIHDSS